MSVELIAEKVAAESCSESPDGCEEFDFLLGDYGGRELMISSVYWVESAELEVVVPAAEVILKACVDSSGDGLVSELVRLFSCGVAGEVSGVSSLSFSILLEVLKDCYSVWIE